MVNPVVVAMAPTLAEKGKDILFGKQKAGAQQGFEEGGSKLQTLGMAVSGGVAGAALKRHDLPEGAGLKDQVLASVTGAGAGALSGFAAKIQHDALEREGGGLMAVVSGAISNAAASTLEKDGPTMWQSALQGAASGYVANTLHDRLTKRGMDDMGNLAANVIQGGQLGYTTLGDGKGAGLGAGAGAAYTGLETLAHGGFSIPGMGGDKPQAQGLDKITGDMFAKDGGNNVADVTKALAPSKQKDGGGLSL